MSSEAHRGEATPSAEAGTERTGVPAARRLRGADRDPGGARRRALPRAHTRSRALALGRSTEPPRLFLAAVVSRGRTSRGGRCRRGGRPHASSRRRRPSADRTGSTPRPTPFSHGPGVALAAIGTLGFGAVLGPEGPLIALGSVAALAFAPLLRVSGRVRTALAAAGSFSAISALFGGPIVGGVMMVEAGAPTLGAALDPGAFAGLRRRCDRLCHLHRLRSLGRPERARGSPSRGCRPTTGRTSTTCWSRSPPGSAPRPSSHRSAGSHGSSPASSGSAWPACSCSVASRSGRSPRLARLLGANSQDVLFSGQSAVPDARLARLDEGPRDPRGREGARVRDLPRLRLQGRAGVSGDLPRDRGRDLRRRLVRGLADAGRRRGRGGRDVRDDTAPAHLDALRDASRRPRTAWTPCPPSCSPPRLRG